MKSRKILSLILAALMVATMLPMAFAADDAADAAADETAAVVDTAEAPAETEASEAEEPAETEAPADEAEAPEEEAAAAETEAPAEEAPAEEPAAEAPAAPVVVTKDAKLNANTVLVNGEKVAFDAYTIEGYNYFKLRDIAAALTGTASNFNVQWDEENFRIALTTGAAYEPIEGDLVAGKGEAAVAATSTKMGVTLNGEAVELSGYSIGGNTYFQLRDLGEKLGFVVDWAAVEKSVVINSSDYVAEGPAETEGPAESEEPAETEASAADAETADTAADAEAAPATADDVADGVADSTPAAEADSEPAEGAAA